MNLAERFHLPEHELDLSVTKNRSGFALERFSRKSFKDTLRHLECAVMAAALIAPADMPEDLSDLLDEIWEFVEACDPGLEQRFRERYWGHIDTKHV